MMPDEDKQIISKIFDILYECNDQQFYLIGKKFPNDRCGKYKLFTGEELLRSIPEEILSKSDSTKTGIIVRENHDDMNNYIVNKIENLHILSFGALRLYEYFQSSVDISKLLSSI